MSFGRTSSEEEKVLSRALARWNITDVSSWSSLVSEVRTSSPQTAQSSLTNSSSREAAAKEAEEAALRAQFNKLVIEEQKRLQAESESESESESEDEEQPTIEEKDEADDEKEEEDGEDHHDDDDGADDDDDDDGEEEEEDEDDKTGPENELEYMVDNILCLDAVNHDLSDQPEINCPYCREGKRNPAEFACPRCAFVRGVCSVCKKVVSLNTLEDPKKGAAVCLALYSDPDLFEVTMVPDSKEESDAIRGQISYMLDSYFDQNDSKTK